MNDNKNNKKVGKVGATKGSKGVESTEAVGGVSGVNPTSTVGRVGQVGAISPRRPTRIMSMKEREQLFKMIKEEADKIFSPGSLKDEDREVVENAVKMAIDSGLVDDDEGSTKKKRS